MDKLIQVAIEFDNGVILVADSIYSNGVILRFCKDFPLYRYEIIQMPNSNPFEKLVIYENDNIADIKDKLVFKVGGEVIRLSKAPTTKLEDLLNLLPKLNNYKIDNKLLYENVILMIIRERKIKSLGLV